MIKRDNQGDYQKNYQETLGAEGTKLSIDRQIAQEKVSIPTISQVKHSSTGRSTNREVFSYANGKRVVIPTDSMLVDFAHAQAKENCRKAGYDV